MNSTIVELTETEKRNRNTGLDLKTTRIKRELNLKTIARDTGWPENYLDAIEEGNWSAIPGRQIAESCLRDYQVYLNPPKYSRWKKIRSYVYLIGICLAGVFLLGLLGYGIKYRQIAPIMRENEATITKLNIDVATKATELITTLAILQDRETEITQLKSINTKQAGDLNTALERIKINETKVTDLQSISATQATSLTKLSTALATAQAGVNSRDAEITNLKALSTTLSTALATAQAGIDSRDAEITNLKTISEAQGSELAKTIPTYWVSTSVWRGVYPGTMDKAPDGNPPSNTSLFNISPGYLLAVRCRDSNKPWLFVPFNDSGGKPGGWISSNDVTIRDKSGQVIAISAVTDNDPTIPDILPCTS